MSKPTYSTEQYWEERYKSNCCEYYEWISKPSAHLIDHIVKQASNSNLKILQIGSGSSILNQKIIAKLTDAQMICIDFSKQIIKKCKAKSGKFSIRYLCMDVRNMKAFSDGQFDLIIDKGTTDCLYCEPNFIKQVLKGMRECHRVLKDGGKMITLSHAQPKFRHYLFRNKLVPFKLEWQIIEKHAITGKQKNVFMYRLTKGDEERAEEKNQQIIEDVIKEQQEGDGNIQENQGEQQGDEEKQGNEQKEKEVGDQEGQAGEVGEAGEDENYENQEEQNQQPQ